MTAPGSKDGDRDVIKSLDCPDCGCQRWKPLDLVVASIKVSHLLRISYVGLQRKSVVVLRDCDEPSPDQTILTVNWQTGLEGWEDMKCEALLDLELKTLGFGWSGHQQ